MILALFALLLTVQQPQTGTPPDAAGPAPGPRHWTDGQFYWRSIPIPQVPAGETGQVQAQFTCTVRRRGAVRDCRIDRALPPDSGFGRRVVGGMSRAELHMIRGVKPGDTITFTLWACSDPTATCERLPWPQD